MSDELVATLWLIGYVVFITVLVVILYPRFRRSLLALVHQEMQTAIDTVASSLNEIFATPTVKKAFSILGKAGGESKAESGLVDQMATDMLDSPQFSAMKLGASALGLDIEGYIEEHGAVKTIQAAQQLAKLAGIDLMKMDLEQLAGSLSRPGRSDSGDNPYLRR